MKDKSTLATIIVAVIIVAATIGVVIVVSTKNSDPNKGSEFIPFAQCLKDAGAKFYGAYWCPHCREQKIAFGKAASFLPYVECANASGDGQTEACTTQKIERYPTWIFKNGERVEGKLSMEILSQKTSCPLPTGTNTAADVSTATSNATTSSAAGALGQ